MDINHDTVPDRRVTLSLENVRTYLRTKKAEMRDKIERRKNDWQKRLTVERGMTEGGSAFGTRNFLHLTLDDLFSLQPGYEGHDSITDTSTAGRHFWRQALYRFKEKPIWIWWQEQKDKFRLFRSQSNAVLVRSKLAFSIIVFVGIATAIQLIPLFIRWFK